MLRRSPKAASAATAVSSLSQGTDSPVSTASSARRLRAVRMRRSAGTLSPDARMTMSPGTSWSAATSWRSPPRSTVAWCESMWRIASSADSALPSCKKPMIALTITAPNSTPVSIQCASAAVTVAAASIT